MTARTLRTHTHHPSRAFPKAIRLLILLSCAALLLPSLRASAQVNGVGQRPYLGWSTFSEQTINSSFLTQANVQAIFNANWGSYHDTSTPVLSGASCRSC